MRRILWFFKMEKKIIEQSLADNFADFWPNFLLSEIYRFRRLTQAAGNPIDAHILQVIAWSHLLSLTSDRDKADRDFDAIEPLWYYAQNLSHGINSLATKKLTVTSISTETSIAFETVRRRVARMEQRGMITKSHEHGALLSTDTEFGQYIIGECKQAEQGAFIFLLHRFCSYMEN